MENNILDNNYSNPCVRPLEETILWKGKPQPPNDLIFRRKGAPYYVFTAYGYAFIGFSLFIIYMANFWTRAMGVCFGILILCIPSFIQKRHTKTFLRLFL
jgi:hypothetical protein